MTIVLYGYHVPGTVDPYVASCTARGRTYTLLECEDPELVVGLLNKLGEILDVKPTLLPSIQIQMRRGCRG